MSLRHTMSLLMSRHAVVLALLVLIAVAYLVLAVVADPSQAAIRDYECPAPLGTRTAFESRAAERPLGRSCHATTTPRHHAGALLCVRFPYRVPAEVSAAQVAVPRPVPRPRDLQRRCPVSPT